MYVKKYVCEGICMGRNMYGKKYVWEEICMGRNMYVKKAGAMLTIIFRIYREIVCPLLAS